MSSFPGNNLGNLDEREHGLKNLNTEMDEFPDGPGLQIGRRILPDGPRGAEMTHQYSSTEKQTLHSYNSQDYFPPDSSTYKTWLEQQPHSYGADRWLVMGLIGFVTGVTGFLIHQIIDLISDTKWNFAKTLLQLDSPRYGLAWLWLTGYSLMFLLASTCLVVFFRPSAAGSGMPEIIGFLNGTIIRHIFNIKTFVVKFISCALAVGSGMPVGPEGPMVHLGSLVGAGISQFQSKTLGIQLPLFVRFRNPEDRRTFITAGAAAGISSAFGAPVGGLLFAMEEVSSFWNMKMSWEVFFCSMVAAFTTDLFNSAFSGFTYTGGFGQFTTNKYIVFHIESGIDINILAIIPSIILGLVGGGMGSLFVALNLQIAKWRKQIQSNKQPRVLALLRVLEPLVIIIITTLLAVVIPLMFNCTDMVCNLEESVTDDSGQMVCLPSNLTIVTKPNVEHYDCPWGIISHGNGSSTINGSYNQAATLFFVTGEKAIQHLFSRNTHLEFDYGPLFTFLVVYFVLSCWASGTQISCGLVVPMLLIGALYGRILGRLTVDIVGVQSDYDWIDPGAFALLGAVSFFAGVTRLTMSLAVIMVEITNDIQFLLLIITTIMFAKWSGDLLTHSLYHSLIHTKCIPFLPDTTPLFHPQAGKPVSLEHFSAKDVMVKPVICLKEVESITNLTNHLGNTDNGGFPIINQQGKFQGLITRTELMIILSKAVATKFLENPPNPPRLEIDYTEFTSYRAHMMDRPLMGKRILDDCREASQGKPVSIDISKYVNRSAVSIHERFSLQRTYVIFRTLGLRHLTVVDDDNRVTGIITRKDLMGFNIDEKLSSIQQNIKNS